jgi:predicted GNAT family acetyltransferase
MHEPADRNLTVRDHPEESRFELLDGDVVVGFADYRVRGDVAVMPHTVIDPSRRGEGLGDVLVAGALEELDGRGLRIEPACWFVADHLRRHPEAARVA